MTRWRGALCAAALAAVIVACGNGDETAGATVGDATPSSLAGFDSMALLSVGTPGAHAPAGVFYYRVVSGSLDWYVVAHHFAGGRAYRVLLTAADGREYAIASRRALGDGTFAAHGVETMLMNRQCVGTEDPSRRSLVAAAPLRIAIKSDGSKPGSSVGSALLGSRSALPCSGNGDGEFDYVLRSAKQLSLTR